MSDDLDREWTQKELRAHRLLAAPLAMESPKCKFCGDTNGAGDPDRGSHRKDDPETIAAMRQGRSA